MRSVDHDVGFIEGGFRKLDGSAAVLQCLPPREGRVTVTARATGAPPAGDYEIWIMRPDGCDARRLTEAGSDLAPVRIR